MPSTAPRTPRSSPLLLFLAATAVLVAFGLRLSAQFSSGVTLVEVYATVTDATGAAVTDLKKSDFQVLEDGAPQTVTAFASGAFPLAVALAIDRSWSMAGERLRLAKQAGRTFLQQLRPSDRSMVIALASDVEVVAPFSTDRADAMNALEQLQPWSTSALHDALIECVSMVQNAQNATPSAGAGPASFGRRALILLSDGIDRYSHATAADALERARESDVLVYPIALVKQPSPLFAEVAVQTGGRSFALASPKELDKTFRAIAEELRHQYLIGYSPARPAAQQSEWRSIEVKVSKPGVRVRARPGYLAR